MPTRDVVFNIIGRDDASPAFSRAAAGAESAAARISRAGDKMVSAGHKMTHLFTLPILGIAAASVKAATDFNTSMTKIQTQAGGSARDVRVLSREVLNLAKTAQQGPKTLADSLYHLKSVGMGNAEAMRALRQSTDLANVSGASLEDTTNALAGAWRTGIQGAKSFHGAVSTLNAVVGAGNMKMTDLIGALGTGILPSAKTFGLTLKDVGSALALFTDEGVPADAAATRLRMSFSLLGAPSQAAEKQLSSIGLTGLKLANDMRKPNGLIRAIGDLKTHLEDPKFKLSLSEQSQLLSHAFGGGRSSSAILSLINNFDVLKQKQAQVTAGMSKFGQDVAAQAKTPAAEFKTMVANLERTGVVIGQDLLPEALQLTHQIEGLVGWFTKLSPAQKQMTIDAALALAALGPVLSILGRITKVGAVFVRMGSWMAAPFRATAAQAQLSAAQVSAAQLEEQAAAERAAAVMAVAEANKARAAADSSLTIWASVDKTNSILAAGAEEAALSAQNFAIAMQSEADAAVRSAAEITVASDRTALALRTQMAGATRSAFGLQSAMAGLGVGLTVGSFTRGASTSTKLLSSLGSAAVGAAIGFSMGGPMGAAIGGLGAGLSSLAIQFLGTGHAEDQASQASQRAKAAAQAQKQTVQSLTSAINADSDALGRNTRAQVAHDLQQSGALNLANRLGLNLHMVTSAALGSAAAQAKLRGELQKLYQDTVKHGGLVGAGAAVDAMKLMRLLGNEGVLVGKAGRQEDQLAAASGRLKLATRSVGDEVRRYGVNLNGATVAGRANEKFLRDHITLLDKERAAGKLTAAGWVGQVRSLQKQAAQYGFNSQMVDQYIARFARVPKSVITQLLADPRIANGALGDVLRLIAKLPPRHNTDVNASDKATPTIRSVMHALLNTPSERTLTIRAEAQSALAQINALGYALAQLQSKTITVTEYQNISKGIQYQPHAAGGPVRDGYFTVGEQGGSRGWELGHKQGSSVRFWSNAQSRAKTGWDRVPGFAGGSGGGNVPNGITVTGKGSNREWSYGGTHYASLMAAENALARGQKAAAQAFRQAVDSVIGSVNSLMHALGSVSSERSAFRSMVGDARKAGASDAQVARLDRMNDREINAIRRRIADTAKVAKVEASLQRQRQAFRQEKSSIRSAIYGSFDPTQAGAGANGVVTFGAMRAQQAQQLHIIRRWESGLRKLHREGFTAGMIAQFAQQGPSTWPQVEALLTASPRQIAQFVSTERQIGRLGGQFGDQAAEWSHGRAIRHDVHERNRMRTRVQHDKQRDRELADAIAEAIARMIPGIKVDIHKGKLARAVHDGDRQNQHAGRRVHHG